MIMVGRSGHTVPGCRFGGRHAVPAQDKTPNYGPAESAGPHHLGIR